jgi:hypothetical protein
VTTTNDNFMGRTEKRHELIKGPRSGAAPGSAARAVLLPGIEIGEEAFVGAGAVVIATWLRGRSWSAPPRVRSGKSRTKSCSAMRRAT